MTRLDRASMERIHEFVATAFDDCEQTMPAAAISEICKYVVARVDVEYANNPDERMQAIEFVEMRLTSDASSVSEMANEPVQSTISPQANTPNGSQNADTGNGGASVNVTSPNLGPEFVCDAETPPAIGGQGRVWRFRDLELSRDVAVKELWRTGTTRIIREAKTAARLRHTDVFP